MNPSTQQNTEPQDDAAVKAKAEQILQAYNEQYRRSERKKSMLDLAGMMTHTRARSDGGMLPKSRIGLKVFIVAIIVMAIIFYGGFALLQALVSTGNS